MSRSGGCERCSAVARTGGSRSRRGSGAPSPSAGGSTLSSPSREAVEEPTATAIEVACEEAKQIAGVGEAHGRSEQAVRRTAAFGFLCSRTPSSRTPSTGTRPADVAEHRARAPWYRTKAHPSVADMLAKVRRAIVAAQRREGRPRRPTQREMPSAGWLLEAVVA